MKVGSIVVVKSFAHNICEENRKITTWMPVQDERTPYMIRDIIKDVNNHTCIRFEEGIIGYHSNGLEIALKIDYVREVDPPESLTEIIKALEPVMVPC